MSSSRRPTARILVVDDEPMVREVVARYLARDGHAVDQAVDGRDALAYLERHDPDLIVLDVMLPAVDGLEVLAHIRRSGDLPVILLTARSDEPDRVVGLELGADDYVVKPFSPRELAARVRSVLRRTAPSPAGEAGGRLEFTGLSIDPASREVEVEGRPVRLTALEFDLLHFLASHPRTVFSRAQLLRQVWQSSPDYQDPATVTVHVRRLRTKVEPDPDVPARIVTVFGVGYRFDP